MAADSTFNFSSNTPRSGNGNKNANAAATAVSTPVEIDFFATLPFVDNTSKNNSMDSFLDMPMTNKSNPIKQISIFHFIFAIYLRF